eukprot:9177249-Prorocentrum_lima.AAC.1
MESQDSSNRSTCRASLAEPFSSNFGSQPSGTLFQVWGTFCYSQPSGILFQVSAIRDAKITAEIISI